MKISTNTIYSFATILSLFFFLAFPYILFSLIRKAANGERANIECFLLMLSGLIIWIWLVTVFSHVSH